MDILVQHLTDERTRGPYYKVTIADIKGLIGAEELAYLRNCARPDAHAAPLYGAVFRQLGDNSIEMSMNNLNDATGYPMMAERLVIIVEDIFGYQGDVTCAGNDGKRYIIGPSGKAAEQAREVAQAS